MAAVPFGFSFGDFVAAIEVIHKAAQALKRSSGAQSNFNQAVADLETFETVLNQVVALSSTTSNPQNFEAIRLCAFQCHPPLAHFLQRVRAYETRLSYLPKSKTHLLDGITGTFWKIKWAVKVEEEVAKLKAAVGPQLVAIGVLLQVKDLEQNAAACQDIHSFYASLRMSPPGSTVYGWLRRIRRLPSDASIHKPLRYAVKHGPSCRNCHSLLLLTSLATQWYRSKTSRRKWTQLPRRIRPTS